MSLPIKKLLFAALITASCCQYVQAMLGKKDSEKLDIRSTLRRITYEGTLKELQNNLRIASEKGIDIKDAGLLLNAFRRKDNVYEFMEALLKAGANPDEKTAPGFGALPILFTVAEKGDQRLFDLLVQYGANQSIKNKAGKTAAQVLEEVKNPAKKDIKADVKQKDEKEKEQPVTKDVNREQAGDVKTEDLSIISGLSAATVEKILQNKHMKEILSGFTTMDKGTAASTLVQVGNETKKLASPEQIGQIIKAKKVNVDNCTMKSDGMTPLHYVASMQMEEQYVVGSGPLKQVYSKPLKVNNVIQMLISAGADIAKEDFKKRTPLYFAVANSDDIELIKIFIDAWNQQKRGQISTYLDKRNSDGNSTLHSAAKSGHPKVAAYLISLGANTELTNNAGSTPLELATDQATKKAMEEAIAKSSPKAGAASEEKKDFKAGAKTKDDKEKEPSGDIVAVFNKVAELKKTISTLLPKEVISLITSLLSQNVASPEELGQIIKNDGINIDNSKPSPKGEGPLQKACYITDDINVIKVLISAGADITKLTPSKISTLHCAALNQKKGVEIIDLLVNTFKSQKIKGLSLTEFLNRPRYDGVSALHSAAKYKNPKVAERLITLGANPLLTDDNGKTPMDFATDPATKKAMEEAIAKSSPKAGAAGEEKKDVKKQDIKEKLPQWNIKSNSAVKAKNWAKDQKPKGYIEDYITRILEGGEKPSFFGVFDGHNGYGAAEYASQNLFKNIRKQMGFPSADAIQKGFIETDLDIKDKQKVQAGTTAATALVIGPKIYIAHVGDSRVLLCKNGQVFWSTQDHQPKTDSTESKRVTDAGGEVQYDKKDKVYRVDKLMVSRTLGDYYLPDFTKPKGVIASPDVQEFDIDTDKFDYIILGSDSVFDKNTNDVIAKIVNDVLVKTGSTTKAAQAVVDYIVKQDGGTFPHDDTSVLVVSFQK